MKNKFFLILVALLLLAALFPSTAFAFDGSEPNATLEFLNGLLQPILLVVLPPIAVAITAWAIRYWQTKKLELNQNQYVLLRWIVSCGMWAAEQAFAANQITKERRETYVIEFVQRKASEYGLKVNVYDIYVMIKAAVGEELNKERYAPSAQKSLR